MKKLRVIYKPRDLIENDIIEIFLDNEKTVKIYDKDEELSNIFDILTYIYASVFSVVTDSFNVKFNDFLFSKYGYFSFFGSNNIEIEFNIYNKNYIKVDLLINHEYSLCYFSNIKFINKRFYLSNNVSIPVKKAYDFFFYKILELYCQKNEIDIELISI